jgi:hypothetical protein
VRVQRCALIASEEKHLLAGPDARAGIELRRDRRGREALPLARLRRGSDAGHGEERENELVSDHGRSIGAAGQATVKRRQSRL